MLLPKEVNEEGEEEDPRAELVEKLLEYKMYKYMAYELKDMQIDAGVSITKGETLPDEVKKYRDPIDYEALVGDMNLAKLQEVFKFMLKREEDKIDPIRSHFGNVEKEEIDMEEKTSYIEDYISKHKTFSFRKLLEKQHSKAEIIVSFLIILEFVKMGRIVAVQKNLNEDILIKVKEG
jgi:segregation and condensation protein A